MSGTIPTSIVLSSEVKALQVAIEHALNSAQREKTDPSLSGLSASEHQQIGSWLLELVVFKEIERAKVEGTGLRPIPIKSKNGKKFYPCLIPGCGLGAQEEFGSIYCKGHGEEG